MISILIHTHNRDNNLKKVLETLENQTNKDFDLNIAETANLESTMNLLKSFKNKLNIRCFRLHFKFVDKTKTLNFLAKIAKGEILTICDSDVVKQNDYLHEVQERTKDKFVLTQYTKYLTPEITNNYMLDKITINEAIKEAGFLKLMTDGCSQISILKDNFLSVGGFDERFFGWGSEDVNLRRRLANLKYNGDACKSFGLHLWHKQSFEFNGFRDTMINHKLFIDEKEVTIINNEQNIRTENHHDPKAYFEETFL